MPAPLRVPVPARTGALLLVALLLPALATAQRPDAPRVAGELRRYHPITVTWQGPRADEADARSPFRDYRLEVTFRHAASGSTLRVPGYFAADGAAGETGATGGDRWRAHFVPDRTGEWSYQATLRTGPDVALSSAGDAGTPVPLPGASGSLTIAETDKGGRDFRARGMLRYVGEHHLRFDNGEWFIKGGVDSPETLLAYADFDGTRSLAPAGLQRAGEAVTAGLHRYESHLRDWRPGDPQWGGGRGRALVGALNYLAGKGLNAISFLTMNVEGDGSNVWPWTAPDARDRFDVSKLDQWERVFSHADSLGLYLHFKTQETENDQLLDGGELGPERRLYYRELVARFAHHLAMNWNLGEENDLWEEMDDVAQTRVRSHAQHLRDLDPYDHHIVIHSYPNQQVEVYVPLLGDRSAVTGASLQTAFDRVHEHTRLWVTASRAAGKKWVVANDEQGSAGVGVKPEGEGNNFDAIRHHTLWGNLMAGGAGVEYYFGYQFAHNDLNMEDFRSRDRMYDYTRVALDFFRQHLPFWEMTSHDGLAGGGAYVLARPGEIYAVYLPRGGEAQLELGRDGAAYTVHWYDPRAGGPLQRGSVAEVRAATGAVPRAAARVSLGRPPAGDGDWVALVRVAR